MEPESRPVHRVGYPALLQIGVVVAGVGFLALVSRLLRPTPGLQPLALAALFGVLYRGLAVLPGGARSPGEAWRPRGLLLLGPGIAAGAALQVLPLLATGPGLLAERWDAGRALASLGIASVCGTALAVLWEELWFRNPVLDRVPAGWPRLIFAVHNGVLFAALHLLNPRFSLPGDGPEVLAAGIFLTMAYYLGGTFYLPLGLHFGNNLAGQILDGGLGSGGRESLAEGPSARVGTALLILGAVAAAHRLSRRTARASADDRGASAP